MTIASQFRDLHHLDEILLMPNAWDAGSAKILQYLGFRAVATTSSGAAAARGQLDGSLDRDTCRCSTNWSTCWVATRQPTRPPSRPLNGSGRPRLRTPPA
ncbi:MAG: isocitrate lyase/phosphoenolpyruvate mutase family protein [Pseudonocardiales bacterium]|nr:isocitrate lyase/phosphoenolpyruvate mutase family protein [Pseudonocardiales bacterium]